MTADARLADRDAGLYARLGVAPDADLAALRQAYRRLARELHPDVWVAGRAPSGVDHDELQLRMALVNEAWSVLSDPERRQAYDTECQRLARVAAQQAAVRRPSAVIRPQRPSPSGPRLIVTRKQAWLDGVAGRIRFLTGYAGRSAVQTMLLRHPGTPRSMWEAIVPLVCQRVSADVGERVRQARVAGAAPLDLANAAALIGLSAYGEELLLMGRGGPLDPDDRRRHAEVVDRIYETLAYELPRELVHAVGNAPKVLRRLQKGR